jgi:hypothetical protein
MERKDESKNSNPSISEIKKRLGLDYPVIHPPIKVRKDGKHLYKVAGYNYPLRWETLERLNIPNQRILYEVDRDEWLKEMREARDEQKDTPEHDDDWWDD